MHVLSSRDIMVAQVVFCQNILLADGIKKEKALKMFSWFKTYLRLAFLTFLVAWTMFSVTRIRLSRADKSTVSETLPPRFTMKITSLYIALLKCHSVRRILTKIHKIGVFRSMIWSLHQFSKQNSAKIQVLWIKHYQSTILNFMSISDTWGFKFKPNISTMLLG